jgi:hypothetical protein
MSKSPKLNEVFLVNKSQLINVGSAYSHGRAPVKAERKDPKADASVISSRKAFVRSLPERGRKKKQLSEATDGKLKPEFEKLVKDFQYKISMDLEGDANTPEAMIEKRLREFAHALEAAEGEDPAELDQGGPAPGTTGRR